MVLEDDELIIMIRKNNEEATMMLLERYQNAMKYVVGQIFSKMRYCGLEKEDLRSVALEAFFHAIETYDEKKACFYSYWKLVTERELYTLIKKHDSKSNQILSQALSYDVLINEDEGDNSFAFFFADENEDVIRRYEGKEKLSKFKEDDEAYFTPIEKEVLKRRMEGYSYEEIINSLEVSDTVIEKALRKSKKVFN